MSGLSRRSFLSLLTAAAVAPLVPMPEIDLGRRIFLPPRGGWLFGRYDVRVDVPGNLLTAELIKAEALRVLHQNLEFMTVMIPRMYDDAFLVSGRTVGDRLTIGSIPWRVR